MVRVDLHAVSDSYDDCSERRTCGCSSSLLGRLISWSEYCASSDQSTLQAVEDFVDRSQRELFDVVGEISTLRQGE
jgi:hypothetical protein